MGIVSTAKRMPGEIASTFKGKHKIKHILYTAGGAVGTYVLGGLAVSAAVVPGLNMIGMGDKVAAIPYASRAIGALAPFVLGYLASKTLFKGEIGKALLVGGAVASIVEALMPGEIGKLIHPGAAAVAAAVPAVTPVAAAAVKGPVNGMDGLDGYVSAMSYQGTGGMSGYVSANSYQGTGGYVSANSYQGTGDDGDDLADDGSDMGTFLDAAQNYMQPYLDPKGA